MFNTLTLRGIGPHKATTLTIPSPRGATTFLGPSQSGKSLITLALTGLFYGTDATGAAFPLAVLRDGSGHIEAATDLGTLFEFSVVVKPDGTRKASRTRTKKGCTLESFPTLKDLLAALPAPLNDPELGRMVLAPFVWRDLLAIAESWGNAPAPGTMRHGHYRDRCSPFCRAAQTLIDMLDADTPKES